MVKLSADVDEAIKGMKEGTTTAVDTIRPTTLTPANDGRTVYIYLGKYKDVAL